MYDKLVDIMLDYVEVDKEDITMDSRFMEDLGFTSFDFMSMLGELEEEFEIEIDQDEITEIQTVGQAVEYLENAAE